MMYKPIARWPRLAYLIVLSVALTIAPVLAAADDASPPVAATVNGNPVFVAEMGAVLQQVKQVQGAVAAQSAQTQAELLKQLVQRRLVVDLLTREGGYYTEEEVQKALENITAQAEEQKVTLEELAAGQGVSLDAWRAQVIWQLAWGRYVERNLTDKLQAYFEAHKKDFDGTEVRASHILLRPERSGVPKTQPMERAEKIREAIEVGKISFEDAAQRFSAGPSGAKGGDLGFFPRYGVMTEGFSKAAFELETGEVSEPILTPFGIHLIRVTEIKPGRKQWTEVLDQMRMPASMEMFENLADKEAETATVEYTGKLPYLDPETGELVTPSGDAN